MKRERQVVLVRYDHLRTHLLGRGYRTLCGKWKDDNASPADRERLRPCEKCATAALRLEQALQAS